MSDPPAGTAPDPPSPGRPSTRSTLQWRVGAVVLLSLAVLLGALVATGPLRVFSGQRLAVDYAFIGPVKPGAAVRLSGMVVGSVEDVELLAGTDLASSKSDARRALDERSIWVNGRRIDGVDEAGTVGGADLAHGRYLLLRRGKKRHHLVVAPT